MILFSSEIGQHYPSYTFGYALYAKREPLDAIADLYAQGFLPYSGSPDISGVFYLARSVRVPLATWKMSSENRRVAKKFDGTLTVHRHPFAEFLFDEDGENHCLAYFAQQIGPSTMPRERLRHILNEQLITHIVEYRHADQRIALIFECEHGNSTHYWFSFYNPEYAKTSLGMWLMLNHVREAQKRNLTFAYLGTCYGEKALYKTNFLPLEWWDGQIWNPEISILKQRARSDAERPIGMMDQWKTSISHF